jgi:hypothetical protein
MFFLSNPFHTILFYPKVAMTLIAIPERGTKCYKISVSF